MMGTRCGKVKRYRPGKAPEWATFVDEDEAIRMTGVVALEKTFPTQEEDSNSSRWDDDRRLIRLANSRINNREDIIADHKRIRLTDNIVSTTREEENARKKELADLDEDTLEERRRILREKLLKRQEEEAAFILEEEEEDEIEKEEEEEFEYETDFENEMKGLVLVKPVFVSKSENGTIAERERLEARKQALEDITKKRMDERKLETKLIVAQEIWKDEQVQKNMELREANIPDVDTDEEVNKEEEREAWKARKIARIKRDEEELMLKQKQKDEIGKVRNMSDEERRQWEREIVKPMLARKKRWRFMQKSKFRMNWHNIRMIARVETQTKGFPEVLGVIQDGEILVSLQRFGKKYIDQAIFFYATEEIKKTAVKMVQFSSLFNGLAKSMLIKNGKKDKIDVGKETADALAKKARKNKLMLSSPGIVNGEGSNSLASVFSKRGQKGMNQDCFVVWEEFGCHEDMIICGIFDGHGPWGHMVAKRVRKLMPSSLLCNWQETLALNPLDLDSEKDLDTRSLCPFDVWKQSYLKTFSAIDQDLEQHPSIDSFHSGTTALTIVR